MRKKVVLVGILAGLCLSGCAGRELEDRTFPTVVTFTKGEPEEQQRKRQLQSGRYRDYGQVKAVVLESRAVEDPVWVEEVLRYLGSQPAFARNVLVFQGASDVLTMFEKEEDGQEPMPGERPEEGSEEENDEEASKGEDTDGSYLENLYKNQPMEIKKQTEAKELPVTLKDLLNDLYNKGKDQVREIPKLGWQNGKLLPELSV